MNLDPLPWPDHRCTDGGSGDSFARKSLITCKLLIFQLAELAEFAPERGFGSFDLQTRYSELAPHNRLLVHKHLYRIRSYAEEVERR